MRMMASLEFVEAPLFTRIIAEYLSDDDYRELQTHLARKPEAGAVIPGTGGFRKLRWDDRLRQRGKRGEVTDLSPNEKRVLKAAVERELEQRMRFRLSKGS